MADIDLQAADASEDLGDGVIFERVDPEGSGTGSYEPFLTIQHKDTEAGFNSTEDNNLDNVDSNGGLDGRTNDLLLSDVPIVIIDGQAYYEFRLDLNEDNNEAVISVEALQIFAADSPAVGADFQGVGEADAFLSSDGYDKVFDLDADGDNRLILSDVTSSGSGTDDYRILIPVELFAGHDPAETYLVLYTEMGLADTALDSTATFEEWNTRLAPSINGLKFLDLDSDGVKDDNEVGLGGVTVFLDEDRDGVFDDGELSTVTNADGTFVFHSVTTTWADGDVWVDEVVPDGYEQTTGTHEVVDVSGTTDVTAQIGNAPQFGSISGTKTADTNNDDTGDVRVEGWTINLYTDVDGDGEIDAGVDELIATTTTDADGNYSFADLVPGDYIVEEETQTGWQAVSAAVVGAEVTANTDTDVDFVNEELGSISGTKTADTNNDDAGDVGVEGWTINLYSDVDGDGEIDEGVDELLDSTTTDSDGNYSFGDLAPGDYIVEEETQTGWQAVSATVVGAEVTAGGDTDVDFVNEELGAISGTKTADTNNDDTGDVGVEGWTINLYSDVDGDGEIDAGVDELLDSTTTDADGNYSFGDLAPGDYIVEEETQTGWQAVSATVVGAEVTAGGDTDVDFVNEELGDISGTKLADTNNDDTGDVGVEGWTINLYSDVDGDGAIDVGVDELLDSTTTDADGNYSFGDLAPGDYIVQEETQTGWQAVSATVVGAEVTAGGDTDVDFVNEELASISGYKFGDLDEDGTWDQGDGEVGIEGWSIALYADDGDGVLDAGDTLLDTVQTDADGFYEFADLAPGDYIVVEATQNGWVQTAPNATDSDTESGDVNGGGGGYAEFGYAIDLGAGDENDANDFGNFLLPGPGVRTPGFWGSPNGLTFWDGIEGNEAKSGPDFPSGELAPAGYLILGDDGDGVAETGELKISVADAQKIINASNKDKGGQAFVLARDAIATWLNFLAGNPIGDPSDEDSAAYYLDEAVDWLIKYVNDNQSGGNALTLDEMRDHNIKTTSNAWQIGTSDDGIESGADIHSALDQYNNDGSIGLLAFAQDGDNGFGSFEQQYQAMVIESGYIL
jgi:protocatechuate 3,4-dioxygenase beta subunit